jgi:hypothetical protein
MALFGAPRRLPNIDTSRMGIMPGDQPGYGMGDFPMGGRPEPQAPQQRPGLGTRLLGKGWEGKAAALGGLLQGDREAVGQYHQMQQLPLLQEAERQRRREDQQWEWANKPREPRINDTVADYEFIARTLGPEMGQKFLQNRADPPRYVQGPDGQFYPVQTAQSPTRPVGRLTPIEGGPGGSPSGAGFPSR